MTSQMYPPRNCPVCWHSESVMARRNKRQPIPERQKSIMNWRPPPGPADVDNSQKPATPPSSGLCASGGGHVFLFSADGSSERCPDGLLCRCGRLRSRWVLCPCCGQARFVGEPIPAKEQP